MRKGYRVIDTDAHQIEPATMWRDYIDPQFADRAPQPDDYPNGGRGMCVEGEPITNQHGNYPMASKDFHEAVVRGMEKFAHARQQGFNAASRLADMDAEGVDAQVIYPTVGGQILGKPFEILNCWRRCAAPTTIGASSTVRRRQSGCVPRRCCRCRPSIWQWKKRCARANAAPRVSTCGRTRSTVGNLHHADYDPLWARLERIGKPVCLHDSGSLVLGRRSVTAWRRIAAGHIIAHPFEAMVAMLSLIWFGVIERHPKLQYRARRGRCRLVAVLAAAHGAALGVLRQRGTSVAEAIGRQIISESNSCVACRGDERFAAGRGRVGRRRLV